MDRNDAAPVEITPNEPAELAVILLHGLGADGHDFEPIVPELKLGRPVRFVLPHAPVRAVTINGGLAMRAWYDIFGWAAGTPEDAAGIRASAALVTRYIDREIERGLAADRIVLAGFSQGGAVALHTALREPRTLAGVIALSTYLPLAATLAGEASAASRSLPIFMAHGTADPLIPLAAAQASRAALERQGYTVEWHTYPMGHSVCPAEVAAMAHWLELRAR
jgi:phospholipase/carboxylesterase